MTGQCSDKRINQSLVACHERRLLAYVVARLPQWVTPDRLTWTGVVGAGIVMLGNLLSRDALGWLWLANLGLVVHWFGDSLDGTLARFRQIERPRYGFYFDQVIDTLGSLMISLGIGLCPLVRMDLSLLVLGIFHMLSIQAYVRAIVDRELYIAVGRLGPTEMRLGIVILNLANMAFGNWQPAGLPAGLHWQDLLLGGTAFGLLLLFGNQMYLHMTRLSREDPGVDA